jgi:1-acyl-sn-glycerol-3-phosphate acyltransferase
MERPDLLASGKTLLNPIERTALSVVRMSFRSGSVGTTIKWLQRTIGTRWIRAAICNLHHVHHTERLPKLKPTDSFILVCNHRSFFDLYAVTPELLCRGFEQRMVFPVRSNFVYDSILGLLVNGLMSFFAMYPPIFRDRKRSQLNMLGLEELIWLLRSGGHFVGFHPEGTRNTGDSYELLPARTGVGHLIRHAQVTVIPVFTNGLLPNSALEQIKGNFSRNGVPIHTVFGAPIDFGELLNEDPNQGLYKRIANRTRDALLALAAEERQLRSSHAAAAAADHSSS